MSLKEKTDEELVELSKKDDSKAFEELMGRYVIRIFNFSRQYAKNIEDAEDIAQDTFFKAWKYIRRFKKDKRFKTWLFTIARNTALDHIRKKKISLFSEFDNTEQDISFSETIESSEPLPSELFEKDENINIIKELLQTLHPDHRSVIMLHYEQEMTFEEIAEVMEKPMNTVKSWHRRALGQLNTIIRTKMPHIHV